MAYVSLRITSLYLRTKSIADKALKKLYKICNFVITCILKVGALLYRVYCGHFKINEIQNKNHHNGSTACQLVHKHHKQTRTVSITSQEGFIDKRKS